MKMGNLGLLTTSTLYSSHRCNNSMHVLIVPMRMKHDVGGELRQRGRFWTTLGYGNHCVRWHMRLLHASPASTPPRLCLRTSNLPTRHLHHFFTLQIFFFSFQKFFLMPYLVSESHLQFFSRLSICCGFNILCWVYCSLKKKEKGLKKGTKWV